MKGGVINTEESDVDMFTIASTMIKVHTKADRSCKIEIDIVSFCNKVLMICGSVSFTVFIDLMCPVPNIRLV